MSDSEELYSQVQHLEARLYRQADLMERAWEVLSVLGDRVDDMRWRLERLEAAVGVRD